MSQKLILSPLGPHVLDISPETKTQSSRLPRVAALINRLFRYNDDLSNAVQGEDETRVRHALKQGADVNKTSALGCTLLFDVVSGGNEAVLRLILENVADVNAKNVYGSTALMSSKNEAMISILLESGANIKEKDFSEKSALHWAVSKGTETGMQVLLKNRAKIDEETNQKVTALHLAVAKQNEGMMRLLLENGANVNAKTLLGLTALHILLEDYKANIDTTSRYRKRCSIWQPNLGTRHWCSCYKTMERHVFQPSPLPCSMLPPPST